MVLVFGVYDVYFGLRAIESASDWSYPTGQKLQLGSAMRLVRLIRYAPLFMYPLSQCIIIITIRPVTLVGDNSGLTTRLRVLVSSSGSILRSLAWLSLVLGSIM